MRGFSLYPDHRNLIYFVGPRTASIKALTEIIAYCLVGRVNNKLCPLTRLQNEKKKKIGKVNLNRRTHFSFTVVLAYRDKSIFPR